MTDVTAAVSPLRRRMIDDMSVRNLSPATQRSYIHAVKRFSLFHGRSPDQLGLAVLIPEWNHCDKGPASKPIRSGARSTVMNQAANASGSLNTLSTLR